MAIFAGEEASDFHRNAPRRQANGCEAATCDAVSQSVRAALVLRNPMFEYVGVTALAIVSSVTRRTYRFERPGARVEVDVREVAFVPNLALVVPA